MFRLVSFAAWSTNNVRGVLYGQVLLAPLGIHMGWCAEGRVTELQCAGPIEVLCVGVP